MLSFLFFVSVLWITVVIKPCYTLSSCNSSCMIFSYEDTYFRILPGTRDVIINISWHLWIEYANDNATGSEICFGCNVVCSFHDRLQSYCKSSSTDSTFEARIACLKAERPIKSTTSTSHPLSIKYLTHAVCLLVLPFAAMINAVCPVSFSNDGPAPPSSISSFTTRIRPSLAAWWRALLPYLQTKSKNKWKHGICGSIEKEIQEINCFHT